MAKLSRRNCDDIREAIENRKAASQGAALLIPTGSTMLNLALTDTTDGGYVPGSVVNLVGDSSAGKTFLLWTMFAEVLHHPQFKHYDIFYDETEQALSMNINKLFDIEDDVVYRGGEDNWLAPKVPFASETVQDFTANVSLALSYGKPMIYGLDSTDALTTNEFRSRIKELIKTGELDGSYNMEKARLFGLMLASSQSGLAKTLSILMLISQTRDAIGVTFGDKKTKSGGKGIKFYCTHEMWLAVEGHIKRKDLDVGVDVICKVKKNKFTGKLRQVKFPIYYDYGVDDTLSCIRYLIENGVAKKEGKSDEDKKATKAAKLRGAPQKREGGKFIIPEMYSVGYYENDLAKKIEADGYKDDLKTLVGNTWAANESAAVTCRQPKYGNQVTED